MSKYQDVRRRYKFVRVLKSEPYAPLTLESLVDDDDDANLEEGNNYQEACVICKGQKYPLFECDFVVMEGSLLASDPQMGSHVKLFTCAKCLNYIYNQSMPAYKAQVRKESYSKKFAELIHWCKENASVAACLPTLAQFATLVNEGRQFKPKLVSHVSTLIASLRSDPARLTFMRWIASVPPEQRSKAAEHIRFRIDATALLTESEQAQMLAFPRGAAASSV